MSRPDRNLVLFRRAPALSRRASLERFARKLRRHLTRGQSFECLITNDREIRKLNLDFRRRDEATDVLSFPSPASLPACDLGSIAISAARARAQARDRGHTLLQELEILMLHGVLHLTGLDHETDRGQMARLESRWRRKLLLPDGLIERSLIKKGKP